MYRILLFLEITYLRIRIVSYPVSVLHSTVAVKECNENKIKERKDVKKTKFKA